MKSTLNTSGLLPEEIEILQNDNKDSMAYFKSVYNTAKKFFIILISSDQNKLIIVVSKLYSIIHTNKVILLTTLAICL